METIELNDLLHFLGAYHYYDFGNKGKYDNMPVEIRVFDRIYRLTKVDYDTFNYVDEEGDELTATHISHIVYMNKEIEVLKTIKQVHDNRGGN